MIGLSDLRNGLMSVWAKPKRLYHAIIEPSDRVPMEERYDARLLVQMLLFLLLPVMLFMWVYGIPLISPSALQQSFFINAIFFLPCIFCVISFMLNRRGATRAAFWGVFLAAIVIILPHTIYSPDLYPLYFLVVVFISFSRFFPVRTALFLSFAAFGLFLAVFVFRQEPFISREHIILAVFLFVGFSLNQFINVNRNEREKHHKYKEELSAEHLRELFEESNQQARQLDILNRVSREIIELRDLDILLEQISNYTAQLLEGETAVIYLVNEAKNELECAASSGRILPDGITKLVINEGIAGKAWFSLSTVYIEDYSRWEGRVSARDYGAVVAVPIQWREQFLGVLVVARASGAEVFCRNDILVLESFSAQAAIAIQNVHLYEMARQEIEERIQIGVELESAVRRYESLFNGVPVGLYRTTPDGEIIEINSCLTEMLGVSDRESLLASQAADFYVEPAERAEWQDLVANNGVHGSNQIRLRRRDGKVIWARDKTNLHYDENGELLYFEGSLEDITETKRAEEEREQLLVQIGEQAEQIQQIMDTVPEGVLLISESGELLVSNPLAKKMIKVLTNGKRIGDTITSLGGEDLNSFLTSPPKGLWHEIDIDEGVYEVVSRPFELEEEPRGWVLVIRDVTRERKVQQYNQQQERLAAIGQLAGGIAHDFNNIMAAIILHTDIAMQAGDLTISIRERLAIITGQARRASDLIQQILDFSRRSTLETQAIDLLPMLKEEVRLLSRTLPENIQIEMNYQSKSCIVNADLTRLQQVIMNLALNARDALPMGGRIRLDLERIFYEKAGQVPIAEMEPGHWVRIRFSDNGTGIPARALPYIFEPFFSTKTPDKGNGLGLAQVYGITRQHNGHILAESEMDKGTTFTIYLPAIKPLDHNLDSEIVCGLKRGAGETILVVEDNSSTRQALRDSLELLGYQVVHAEEGREALQYYTEQHESIDLVLSDLVMPEMGGRALLHALKAIDPDLKFVLLTGHLMRDDDEDLRQAGASAWMQKPVTLDTLSEMIGAVLAS